MSSTNTPDGVGVATQKPQTHADETPLRVGVVGLGYWGPNLLRVLSEREGTEVAWICDRDRPRLSRFARRFPTARATANYEDLLADQVLDAIFIATPVFTHFDLALRSLEAGKHTFVEKPLAPSPHEAEELLGVAAERSLTLMCGHTFLYSPPVRMIGNMLKAKQLGKVFFISSSRVNLGLHQSDVSVIWDLGPHDFSILLYWLGVMPCSVRASGRDSIVPGIPDVAFVMLTFPDGLIVNVELSWLAPSKLRRTVLVGSEKMVVYSDGSPEPVRVFDSGVIYEDPETFGEYHLSYRTGDITSPRVSTGEPLMAELGDFLGAVASGDPRPEFAQIARDVVILLAAADQSLREGGREITVGDFSPVVA
ncbi:MAG: Gfo/Idh/MocA family oxidoreductase [Solirubrobacterales bacterium]|nr:Gfo/Idh/MocA family oxidoreductase [Solirubrobacterales bacterium]